MSESKFKVGDMVVRTGPPFVDVRTGDVLKIDGLDKIASDDVITLEGVIGTFDARHFELHDTSKYHVHHDEIIAWAKGAKIEYEAGIGTWFLDDNPTWCEHAQYRVYEEPVTSPRDLEMERIEAEMRNLADALEALKESE